jgi:hypothetical protein
VVGPGSRSCTSRRDADGPGGTPLEIPSQTRSVSVFLPGRASAGPRVFGDLGSRQTYHLRDQEIQNAPVLLSSNPLGRSLAIRPLTCIIGPIVQVARPRLQPIERSLRVKKRRRMRGISWRGIVCNKAGEPLRHDNRTNSIDTWCGCERRL